MFSKAARWSSSHRYIQAIVFSKGSYSIGLNSSLLYQITFHHTCSLLITRDISGCFLGGGNHFLSCIFVGHAYKISLPLSGSLSPHVFLGAGQPRRRAEFASVVFRSCILSHGIPDRSPYIHTLWCFFSFSPSLSVSSPFFFVSEGSVPQNHWLPHLD